MVQDRDSTKPSGGVYTIPILYKNDYLQYISQTIRDFKVRLNEHKKNIKLMDGNTALKIFLNSNLETEPVWKDARILAAPYTFNELIWREALEIELHNDTVNGKDGKLILPICVSC